MILAVMFLSGFVHFLMESYSFLSSPSNSLNDWSCLDLEDYKNLKDQVCINHISAVGWLVKNSYFKLVKKKFLATDKSQDISKTT